MNMKEVRGIHKYIGLMGKKAGSEPLLFRLGRYERSIHSFFCPSFEARWLDANKKIIRIDKVKPFTLNVRAPSEAVWLVEIP